MNKIFSLALLISMSTGCVLVSALTQSDVDYSNGLSPEGSDCYAGKDGEVKQGKCISRADSCSGKNEGADCSWEAGKHGNWIKGQCFSTKCTAAAPAAAAAAVPAPTPLTQDDVDYSNGLSPEGSDCYAGADGEVIGGACISRADSCSGKNEGTDCSWEAGSHGNWTKGKCFNKKCTAAQAAATE